jgi:hypothetical protein
MKPNLKKVRPTKPLRGLTPIGQGQNIKEKNRGEGKSRRVDFLLRKKVI